MITAKEILKDKQGIYRKMSESELKTFIDNSDMGLRIDLMYFLKSKTQTIAAHKLYLRWHYADGRPKPPRVHEVIRLREQMMTINNSLCSSVEAYNALMERFDKKSDKLIECEWQANLLRSEVLSLEAKNRRILIAAGIAFVLVLGLIGLQIFG